MVELYWLSVLIPQLIGTHPVNPSRARKAQWEKTPTAYYCHTERTNEFVYGPSPPGTLLPRKAKDRAPLLVTAESITLALPKVWQWIGLLAGFQLKSHVVLISNNWLTTLYFEWSCQWKVWPKKNVDWWRLGGRIYISSNNTEVLVIRRWTHI